MKVTYTKSEAKGRTWGEMIHAHLNATSESLIEEVTETVAVEELKTGDYIETGTGQVRVTVGAFRKEYFNGRTQTMETSDSVEIVLGAVRSIHPLGTPFRKASDPAQAARNEHAKRLSNRDALRAMSRRLGTL